MSAAPFVRRHIGPSPEDIEEMARAVGAESLDDLIDQTVPESIRLRASLNLPAARSEEAALRDLREMMERERTAPVLDRDGLHQLPHSGGDSPEHSGKSGLVHRLHPVSGGDRAGTHGGPAELPDDGLRLDRNGNFECVACWMNPRPPRKQ